jgi:hypothetical protein
MKAMSVPDWIRSRACGMAQTQSMDISPHQGSGLGLPFPADPDRVNHIVDGLLVFRSAGGEPAQLSCR